MAGLNVFNDAAVCSYTARDAKNCLSCSLEQDGLRSHYWNVHGQQVTRKRKFLWAQSYSSETSRLM